MTQAAQPIEASGLAEIANQLTALADGLRASKEAGPTDHNYSEIQSHNNDELRNKYLKLARQTYDDRRRREQILGTSDLLGEPAWDILLDLYIAQSTAQEVSVSSACIGSAAPATTGLRWLGVLQEAGLVTRINDDEDHRRVLVKLSPEGADRMDRYFAEVAGIAKPRPLRPVYTSTPAASVKAFDERRVFPETYVNNAQQPQND